MKGPVIEMLKSGGHEVTDFGAHSEEPVDFPDVSKRRSQNSITPSVPQSTVVVDRVPYSGATIKGAVTALAVSNGRSSLLI